MKLKQNSGYPTVILLPILVAFSIMLVFVVVLNPDGAEPGRQEVPVQTSHSVEKKAAPAEKPTPSKDHVLYLTFDDGPGRYTDRLLDILRENNVKATFFVTNCHPEYQDLIARVYAEGHAGGVHSYSHDYKKIYSSEKAFWQDYSAMDAVIYKQTGHHARLLRFPGGSSNAVSRKYSKGIMRRLTRQATDRGLVYVDWNAQCGDSDGIRTSYGVYRRLTREIGNSSRPQHIILCHDIKPYTVAAMDDFIKWAKANGYTFEVLSPSGFDVHQPLSN